MFKEIKEVTVISIGETGVGKSENGNALLKKKDAFYISDLIGSCTSEINLKSNIINGIKVNYIDTQGLSSTNDFDEKYIFQFVNFLKNCKSGINAFFIILDIQNPRFDSRIQRMLKLINDIFNNPKYWNQVGIIFTRCYKECFNRKIGENNSKISIINFIHKLPGCENINPSIPCFFVDSKKWETDRSTQSEYGKIVKYASILQPIRTDKIKVIHIEQEPVENEILETVLVHIEQKKKEITYYYEDQERKRIIKYDGNVLFSLPKVIRTYSETVNTKHKQPPPPPLYMAGVNESAVCLIL